MSAFVAASRLRGRFVCLIVSVAMPPMMLGGCAGNTQSVRPPVLSWKLAGDTRLAPAPQQKVELEDDGVPVQTAPNFHVRHSPDDPTQPWSPNYGRAAVKIAPASTLAADKLRAQTQVYRVAETAND